MTPPPPRSTLFPYTTLFRSRRAAVELLREQNLESRRVARCVRASRPSVPATRPRDRKSTRLNSSHQIISYAVFCLKKKKINYTLHFTISDDAVPTSNTTARL